MSCWFRIFHGALFALLLVPCAHAFDLPLGTLDFTPRGTQPGLTHPIQGASECVGCHTNGPLEGHYPGASWSGSMMANAGRDPLFWAALDVANNDIPGVGDYCLRCHSPGAWLAGRVRKDGAGGVVDGTNGCLLQGDYDASDYPGNDYQGINCHFCHRAEPGGPNGEALIIESGDIWIDDVECAENVGAPCRKGPYRYPAANEFVPPHPWEQSAHLGSSEMCGTCHNVTTPFTSSGPAKTLIIDNGTNPGLDTGIPFPIERTYSEWLNSDYSVLFADGMEGLDNPLRPQLNEGQTCQSCHMRDAGSSNPLDEFLACFFGPNRNGDLPVHEFVGGNTWIPAILNGQYPELDRSLAYLRTAMWAEEMIRERSATVTVAASSTGADTLAAEVTVTNLSGHKLPTGYGEGRRMWLEVWVEDVMGQRVWSNGDWDPATGELDVDGQTRIYEVKQGIWNAATGTCDTVDGMGREMFHFVLNNCVAKDNRIPPLGFVGGDDLELRAVGATYPPVAPGSERRVNFDVAAYTIALPPATQFPVSVKARLRYQIASKDYIEFLRNEAVENAIPGENLMCAAGPGRPFTVGPQALSRGEYLYELWSNPALGYGRSPPVDTDVVEDVVAAPLN